MLLHRESNNIKLQSCLAGGGGQLAVDPEKLKEKEFDLGFFLRGFGLSVLFDDVFIHVRQTKDKQYVWVLKRKYIQILIMTN